ncbi:hypothetical protein AFNJKBDN_CDS0026 [Halorubrum virus V_ICIS4]|nr:hypothetical protein AFNJKBDN_CDS0026 [Halorubrum virus V_ICIS4]
MSDHTPRSMCTHRSCVCVYFGRGRCVSPSEPQTRNRHDSRRDGRLHFHRGSGSAVGRRCCCSECIHYNYIHTYIRETYGVCNWSVNKCEPGGAAG